MTPHSDTSRDDDESHNPTVLEAPPTAVAEIFGDRTELIIRYVEWLSGPGIERGLMGPREAPRLWDRHVLNSASAESSFGQGEQVVDVGSGAGLPGIPLALARPDLRVILVEPLLRRVKFLEEVVQDLGLEVKVIRGRAEDRAVIREVGEIDAVTSRAVAPLAKIGRWSVPLMRVGGRMVALKGLSAEEEMVRDRAELEEVGLKNLEVRTIETMGADPTRVVLGRRGR